MLRCYDVHHFPGDSEGTAGVENTTLYFQLEESQGMQLK